MAWGNDKQRGNRHQRGYGSDWEKIRKQVLKRDQHLCQPCHIEGRLTVANQVDHIIPKARGGTDDPTNLQAICGWCHKKKTANEGRYRKGCDAEGNPVDPDSHWNREAPGP